MTEESVAQELTGKGSRRPRWGHWPIQFRKRLLSYNRWNDDGPGGPPNDGINLTIPVSRDSKYDRIQTHDVFVQFSNDAFEIWIGETYTDGDTKDETWKFSCRTEHFRRIALWYLWRWMWGEWFGLRRKLFYWDLHRRMTHHTISEVTDVCK